MQKNLRKKKNGVKINCKKKKKKYFLLFLPDIGSVHVVNGLANNVATKLINLI